jgi:hypothetical protein
MDLNILFNRISDFYIYKAFDGLPVYKIVSTENWPQKITHNVEPPIDPINQLNTAKSSRVDPDGKTLRVKIKPVYTGDLLTGAIVTTNNIKETPLYYLHYKYDSKGRLTEERWEKLIEGKRSLWIEVENRFFDPATEFK